MANPNVSFSISATEKTARAFGKVRSQMRGMQRETRGMGASVKANRRVIQQAGMQLSDFAVQVGGGQSAILAFTQNAPQFIQNFGAIGGVLAAVTTIAGTLALVMVRTGKSLNDLTPIAGILEDEFKGIARVLGVVKEAAIDFANLLVNNLDRVFITVATFAGFMAGKWVVSFIAARGAVALLTSSLLLLRATLIRLGFTALIVAAGELVFQFTRLVKAAGGFGEALVLLKDLGIEVFQRIAGSGDFLVASLSAGWKSMKATFMEELQGMIVAFTEFTWDVANGLNNLFGTNLTGVSNRLAWDMFFDAKDAREAANEAVGAAKEELDKLTAPLPALEKIRALLKSTDDTGKQIDVRDWFKGVDDATGNAKSKLEGVKKEVQSLADTMKDTFTSGFMDIIKGTKSVGDAFRSMAAKIIEKLFEVLVVQRMVGSFDVKTGTGTGIIGGIAKLLFPSFSGGGFTGMGPRTGGLDGKGGFMAMLHPNETVVDHTVARRGGGGAGGDTIVVNQSFNFQANGDESVKQLISQAAPKIMEATKSAIINDRRRGGQMKAAFS